MFFNNYKNKVFMFKRLLLKHASLNVFYTKFFISNGNITSFLTSYQCCIILFCFN